MSILEPRHAFPGHFADLLGFKLTQGRRSQSSSAGGSADSFEHMTTIEIYGADEKHLFTVENIPVGYMPKLPVPLLGVRHFLENFRLRMDYPGKKF